MAQVRWILAGLFKGKPLQICPKQAVFAEDASISGQIGTVIDGEQGCLALPCRATGIRIELGQGHIAKLFR